MYRHVISGLAMALLATVSGMSAADDSTAASAVLHYPAAARGPVVETLHGTEVADPYRWMETASPEVAAWVTAENAVSQPYLGAIPARAAKPSSCPTRHPSRSHTSSHVTVRAAANQPG